MPLNPGDFNTGMLGNYSVAGETFITSTSQSHSSTLSTPGGILNFKFTLDTFVYSNPGTGGLDFLYILTNTAANDGSGDTLDRVTLSSFANYSVDADYQQTSLLNATPWQVDRSGDIGGTVVGYDFSFSPIAPGQASQSLIVRTNSLSYVTGTANVIDSTFAGVPINVPFGGTVPAPEPSSLAVLAVSMGLLVRRRRTVK